MQTALKISIILIISLIFNFDTIAQIVFSTTANVNQCEQGDVTQTGPNASMLKVIAPFSVVITNTSDYITNVEIQNIASTPNIITRFQRNHTLMPGEEKTVLTIPNLSEVYNNRLNDELNIHYTVKYRQQGRTILNEAPTFSPWIQKSGTVSTPICPDINIENNNNGVTITPNPFRNTTTIKYFVPNYSPVTIEVYSGFGELKRTVLRNFRQETGMYEVSLNGVGLTRGLYLLKVQIGGEVKTYTIIKR